MNERVLTVAACLVVAALLGLLGGILVTTGQHPYTSGCAIIGLALLLIVLGGYFAGSQPTGKA